MRSGAGSVEPGDQRERKGGEKKDKGGKENIGIIGFHGVILLLSGG
nr:MAG TPA: hypothetical protein [Caudoviricetes sp.]